MPPDQAKEEEVRGEGWRRGQHGLWGQEAHPIRGSCQEVLQNFVLNVGECVWDKVGLALGGEPRGTGPLADGLCLRNSMFLSPRAGQGTWDLLATKE